MKRIAHRANSIVGLRALRDLNCDGVEIDLQASADGILYAVHDAFVMVHGRRRRFTSLSSQEIAAAPELNAVPTLTAVLDELKEMAGEIVFDVKSHGVASPLAAVLDDSDLRRRTLVMSFSHDHLKELRRQRSDVECGLVIGWSRAATTISGAFATMLGLVSPIAAARRLHCSVAVVPVWRTSSALVDAAHRRKVDVYLWSRKTLRYAPLGLNVDGALVDVEPG
ncbi:MAG TPA: glycerophosphodiester phosphodiesterase [Thermoanaerobaculia bacterium]|jgi:glycerophosphoryl diester phosphodiesterase|nr:glycerophosphodiester phosphodiesterase [Thermoanaerobaculia bacterium]